MLSCVRAPTHTHNIMYEVNLHQRVTQITTPPRLRLNPHHEWKRKTATRAHESSANTVFAAAGEELLVIKLRLWAPSWSHKDITQRVSTMTAHANMKACRRRESARRVLGRVCVWKWLSWERRSGDALHCEDGGHRTLIRRLLFFFFTPSFCTAQSPLSQLWRA